MSTSTGSVRNRPWTWIRFGVALLSLAACALPQEVTRTPRNIVEQLLLTSALKRSLAELTVPVPMEEGELVAVEVTGLQTDRAQVHLKAGTDFGVVDAPSWDLAYVRDAVSARLGRLGYRIAKPPVEGTYLVRVMVESMGTNQGRTFFGMPEVQSVLIPFALPQITIFEELDQLAHVRLYVDCYDNRTGRLIPSSPLWAGSAYYNQYTILFFIGFARTDLLYAP